MSPNQIPSLDEIDALPLSTTTKPSSYGLAISKWRRFTRAFSAGFHETHPDQLEQWLMVDSSQNGFLKDYRKLKELPGKDIIKCLTRYYVVNTRIPPASVNISEEDQSNADISHAKDTFSNALDELSAKIRPRSHRSLQVCLLSLKSPDTLRSKLFRFKDKAFCSVQTMNAKYDLPSRSILTIVEKEWDPEWIQAKNLINNPFSQNKSRARRPCKLPSKVSTLHHLPILNRGSDCSIVELSLVPSAPLFRGDFYEYVWQRQNDVPQCERLVFFTCRSDHLGSRNLLITIDSSGEITNSNRCGELLIAFHGKLEQLPQLSSGILATDDMEITYIRIVLAALSILADSTCDFVNDGLQSILDLQYQGRRSPSGSKLNYLSHLDDCTQIAIKATHDALKLLAELKSFAQSSIDITPLQSGIQELERDLIYLEARLEDMTNHMITLKPMLKEKLDLRQIRRNYILTVLAAIFLPVSFMAALFGMNISDPWPSADNATLASLNYTLHATVLPSITSNTSEVIAKNITVFQDSGTYLWTFQTYWKATIPITIGTIMVPLVIGNVFRSLSRFAFDYRGHWRIIVIITIILSFKGLTAISVKYAYKGFWHLVYTLCLAVPALFLTAKSLVRRQHRRIWFGFMASIVFYVLVWVLGAFEKFIHVVPYIPLAYLLVVWFRHDIRDLYRRIRNSADANVSTDVTAEQEAFRPSHDFQGQDPARQSGDGISMTGAQGDSTANDIAVTYDGASLGRVRTSSGSASQIDGSIAV
ncbi:hypothetical protein VTL71DRAFT_2923 [Oculimacula yallundae]|uniref:Uncharacterized protein n=1 Tax=Oculimacula yallundae TaxID=86028 RepID=A0ABR4C7J6_9HELO